MVDNNLENPFKQPEDWEPWFEGDRKYMNHFKKSLNSYLKNHNLNLIQNNFMSSNLIIIWLTKHALLGIIIGIAILSTITASAAQIFLPPEIKPTRLLNIEKSSSSSKSSIQFSSVSSSLNSSTASSVSSTKISSVVITPQPKTQTYTNEYFPDFKLVYPDDWKFENATEQFYNPAELSVKEQSLARRLFVLKFLFTKNNYTFSIFINALGSSCNGPDVGHDETEFLNGLKKFTSKPTADYPGQVKDLVNYGIDFNDCIHPILISNIDMNKNQQYMSVPFGSATKVTFIASISTPNLLKNDPLVSEIDQIISQSVFK